VTGATGATGPAGPQGPSGILASGFVDGFSVSSIPTTLTFLSPQVTLTVAAGQKVTVISTAALGTTGAAGGLRLWICYRQGAGAPVTWGGGLFDLNTTGTQRNMYSLSADISGLAAGSYSFGLCGLITSGASWTNNEWTYTTAFVHT
jgi:hypothetical protein